MQLRTVLFALTAVSAATLSIAPSASAQQPYGWVANDHVSAYTLAPLEVELSGHYLWLDSNVDAFGVRGDVRSANPRLTGDSGELDGQRGAIRVGLWHGLDVFYQRQDQELTLELAADERADIPLLDNRLDTRSTAWGAKWVFYESRFRNRNQGWESAALELIREEHRSDDFTGHLQTVHLEDGNSLAFDSPQRFALDRLRDKRWQARLIYTSAVGSSSNITTWFSYGEADATAGTSAAIELAGVQEAFQQSLDIDEKQYSVGFSLNLQGKPRLPVQLSYEYIHVQDRKERVASQHSALVPGFLRSDNPRSAQDHNHVITASTSWWVTPHMYLGATARVATKQYTGQVAHFNNPLTGSLNNELYSHVEVTFGIRFGGLHR